jgi:hypothetical protein
MEMLIQTLFFILIYLLVLEEFFMVGAAFLGIWSFHIHKGHHKFGSVSIFQSLSDVTAVFFYR